MTSATLPETTPTVVTHNSSTSTDMTSTTHPKTTPSVIMNNRPMYVAWGLAWLIGYGAYALTPILALPAVVAPALLAAGVAGALLVTGIVTARAQKGVTGPAALAGRLLGGAWVVGFTALFLLITGLAGVVGDQSIQTVMWPAGSGLVVGLVYLMGGAVQRDVLQYALGTWLALISTAAVFLSLPGLYWVLALAGTGGYAVAAILEPRRRAVAAAA